MGEGQALQSRTEPEKAGLQGGAVSMDSSYPQALKRRSLPTALRHPLRTSDLVT